MHRHRLITASALLCTALALTGCGAQSIAGSTPAGAADVKTTKDTAATKGGAEKVPKPDGVYSFGDTVKFDDGSTLTVTKPVKFRPAEYASGGEKSKYHVKVRISFVNKSGRVFDPALTTEQMTSADEEAEEVYQEGFDSPTNKILPGKKISWSAGFGVKSAKSQTLTVSMGAFDYADVIFTNDA